ncbi:MAG: hypothetical protein ACTSUE_23495 [Promethearchaeota archaeon]
MADKKEKGSVPRNSSATAYWANFVVVQWMHILVFGFLLAALLIAHSCEKAREDGPMLEDNKYYCALNSTGDGFMHEHNSAHYNFIHIFLHIATACLGVATFACAGMWTFFGRLSNGGENNLTFIAPPEPKYLTKSSIYRYTMNVKTWLGFISVLTTAEFITAMIFYWTWSRNCLLALAGVPPSSDLKLSKFAGDETINCYVGNGDSGIIDNKYQHDVFKLWWIMFAFSGLILIISITYAVRAYNKFEGVKIFALFWRKSKVESA